MVEANPKAEWDRRTSWITPEVVERVLFQDFLDRYLPNNTEFSCIEIGAIPGNFLVFFEKKKGYKVTGVDFSTNSQLFHDTMKLNEITNYQFYTADFLTWRSPQNYDVVTSFGFIEHFDDPDQVVLKHIDLVKSGGFLVISVPNFRYLQHVYRALFDRENLDFHNVKAMNRRWLSRLLESHGLEKQFHGYLGRLEVWRESPPLGSFRKFEERLRFRLNQLGRRLPNSRLYSPYLLAIYRRKHS